MSYDCEKNINIEKLKNILNAKAVLDPHENNIYIGPRLGTISPWSSKATDILKNCGLDSVNRIEHARCIKFNSKISEESISPIYDRMMESIYSDVNDLKKLFDEHKPKQDELLSILNFSKNLTNIDEKLGLALSNEEKNYLIESYTH